MARTVSYVFGAVLAVVGLWGFVQNPVLGIFGANTLHSIVHLVSGVALLGIAAWWAESSALGLKIFGVVYAVVAVLGFVMGGETILGLIDNSLADNILHTALALVFLWAGFMGDSMGTERSMT
jgi:hypothetical protein